MFFFEDPKYQRHDPKKPEEFGDDVIISPDTRRDERIPPGQSRTRKWPVLDAFGSPQIDASTWSLRLFGAVEQEQRWSLSEFRSLPRIKVFSDFHCVTKWSRLGNLWEGVSTAYLLNLAKPNPEATHVVLHAYDHGWTTNLPLRYFSDEDVLLADIHDGMEITLEHGGPVRAVVPKLYAWKSAKWISGIELVTADRPGYWENGGYHLRGDPWMEERFRDDW